MEVMTGYKQTEVGVIPEDWDLKSLAAIADKIMVGIASAATHAYRDKGIAMFRNQNIKVGYLDDSDLLFIAPEYEVTFKNKRLRGGDLLTARTGYPGVTAIVPNHYDSAQSFTTLITRPKPSEVDSDYLCQYINSETGQKFFAQSQIGGAQKNVNASTLRAMPIPLPRSPEQRAIAAALNDVNALLGALERLIAKKRDLKQAAMQQLLTGQTRLPGKWKVKTGYKQTEVGVIPEDWEVSNVLSLITCGPKNGYSGRSGKDTRGTPTLSLTATSSGRIILDGETVKYLEETLAADSDILLKAGDVLVQRSNTTDLVGTTAIFEGPDGVYAYPDLMMRLRFKTMESANWFWRYANSSNGHRYFVSVAAGSTGSMPKVSGESLRCMPIPLPHRTEQRAITEVLADMDAELAGLEQRLAKTRALKQGMMQELLTGRTRLA